MVSRAGLVAVVVLAAALSGCVSSGIYETAQTAPPGQVQAGGGLAAMHLVADGAGLLFLPVPTAYGKIGLSDRMDLGLAWTVGPGLGANLKYQFLDGGVDGALYLGGSFYGMTTLGSDALGFGYYSLNPRLIFSDEAEEKFPFMLNAGATYMGVTASDGEGGSSTVGLYTLNGGLGFPLRFGSKRDWRFMPEIAVNVPLSGNVDGEISQGLLGEGFTASLCFSFTYAGSPKGEGQ